MILIFPGATQDQVCEQAIMARAPDRHVIWLHNPEVSRLHAEEWLASLRYSKDMIFVATDRQQIIDCVEPHEIMLESGKLASHEKDFLEAFEKGFQHVHELLRRYKIWWNE